MGFLRQVTWMKARRLGDNTWTKEGLERLIQTAGTKPLWEYINKKQAMVVEWVALRPIFEVCAKEKGYEGGGILVICGSGRRLRSNNWRP